LLLLGATLLALSSGCASSGSKMAPQSPAPAYYGDDLEVDADEAVPLAEPAGDEGYGGGMPPPPSPPAEERFARAGQPQPQREPAAGPPLDGATTTPPPVTTDVPAPPDGQDRQTDPQLAGPLLIYNATLHLAVYETAQSIDGVQKLATDLGGYLVRRDDRTIVVRVPAKAFRTALAGVGKLGDVLHREESVQDVTDEFYDLQVRLKNAHAMRNRLAKLLEQATNVEEALMVEKELGRITEQIERFEGKLKLLKELIAFSTITVEFKPRPTDRVSNVRLPFPWLNQLGLSQLLSL
jgi:hypothetical protein